MDQSRNEEGHNMFSGQNTQELDLQKILEDEDAFEEMFFSTDNNPNKYIDLNYLHELLNEENGNEGVHFVVGNEGGFDHGSNMEASQVKNGVDRVIMNVKQTGEQNVKKWKTRNRVKSGSKDSAEMRELKKIRNRETATRAYAAKKARIEKLEFEVQKFRKKNANLKTLLVFAGSSMSFDRTRKQLKRTASTNW